MFEDSTPQRAAARRSAWPLAISVLLHAGAIAALVAAGARGPAPGAGERPIDILFLRAARAAGEANGAADAPAAAAASPAERLAARLAERRRQAMLDRLVQPTGIPGAEPAAAAAAPGTARPAGAEAPGGETELPVEAGGGVVSPVLIESSGVQPVYPEEALRAGLEGLVVLEAVVDERGRVGHDVKVVRRLGLGCDEAAVAAVRQWRFRPATRDGKPIKVRRIFPILFRLQP